MSNLSQPPQSISAKECRTLKRKKNEAPLPGDLAIWFFILAELAVFSALFITYAFVRSFNIEVFNEGFEHLNRMAGMVNTMALITSSYFVVRSVDAIRRDNNKACVAWLLAALAAGMVYVVVKLWEYAGAVEAGYGLSTNTFYTFYFLVTGFHFAHVLLGMVILAAVALKAAKGGYSASDHFGVETGASYWHMVDLAWVVLFPLVYVIH